MTTIATDGRLFSADGRSTNGDTISGEDRRKLFRLPDGSIVGVAGRTRDGERAISALIESPSDPQEVRGDYTLLRLTPKGKVEVYEETTRHSIMVKPPYAIGSGRVPAVAAMLAGADAREAVKIATKLDVHSGGKITSYSI